MTINRISRMDMLAITILCIRIKDDNGMPRATVPYKNCQCQYSSCIRILNLDGLLTAKQTLRRMSISTDR